MSVKVETLTVSGLKTAMVGRPCTLAKGQRGTIMSVRIYRVALVVSLALNVALILGFWLYLHFAATLSIVEDAVGFFD